MALPYRRNQVAEHCTNFVEDFSVHIVLYRWEKYRAPRGVVTPRGRRGHTAVVWQDCMYIYGGYQDLRGSTGELWAFHLASRTWHLVSQGGAADCPGRHHHTALVHQASMWVFGGMSDLLERSDCWRFNFGE